MTRLWMAIGLLVAVAAPSEAASPRVVIPHGPPPIPQTYVCKVETRYGGGSCTTVPYAHLGVRCSCEGRNGPRYGVVAPR